MRTLLERYPVRTTDDQVYLVYRSCGCIGTIIRRYNGTQTRFIARMVLAGERVEVVDEVKLRDMPYRCVDHVKVAA